MENDHCEVLFVRDRQLRASDRRRDTELTDIEVTANNILQMAYIYTVTMGDFTFR